MKTELYTLIAGATQGIDKGFALECAKRGMSLKKELIVKKNIIKEVIIL